MLQPRLMRGRSILMTADAVGGIWTYAVDLGRALAKQGAVVVLAVLGPEPDAGKRRIARDAGLAVEVLGHPPEWLADGPEAVARAGEALADLARATRADLLHLNHPALAAEIRFDLPVVAICHSCVATWWAAVEGTRLPPALAWQAELVGRGLRAADAVVAPSRAFAEATQAIYRLAGAPFVVPNGRVAPPVAADTASPECAALAVGRLWDRGKNLATLDRAAALTAVPIRAAGPTEGPEGSLIGFAHLQRLGPLPDAGVRDLLARRPIFASAARYEPFGLSVLEAAQAGCALVLSDIPTFRELWSDAALFIGADDAAGFAAAIDRLADDAALRRDRGRAAQERADRYRLDLQAERMTELYAALLRPAAAGSHAA